MSETVLPLRAVYERIPETATPAQVREIFDSSAVCLEGFEGAWLHDGGGCDCEKRPGYESTIRQIANAYTKVLAEKRSASLYDRVEAWQKDFLKKHFTGSHGSTSYYGDAASGLAIALQEIDRARYERTSSQVWNEAQSLAPSENLQSEGAVYQDGVCRDHAPWKRCRGCEHIPQIESDFPRELRRTSQAEGLITKEYAREHGAVFPGDE